MSYQDEEEGGAFDGHPSSFPKDFGYGAFDGGDHDVNLSPTGEQKPRILLMGLRRSGKSSIQKVVFHKMSPNETLFLESTNKIMKDDINNSSFVQFQIWDFPGQIDFFDSSFDSDMIFGGCGALVFVIDAQDDYMEALNKLNLTVTKAFKVNQNIKFEVFIHKVDGLGDDFKMESQRDIHQRATDDLIDSGYDQIHLSFHLTSIYDHSIFEAFSKVVQKLIPQLPALENLLNILNTNSAIEKSFLFDVVSKIYIATDSTPVDMQSYELCCDMIDVVIDVSWIYGYLDDLQHLHYQICWLSTSLVFTLNLELVDTVKDQHIVSSSVALRTINVKEEQDPAAFDEQSSSLIKLNNGTVLYLREVNKFLALVCILREDNFDHKGIIDYNFLCFREAIQQVFELRNKCQAMANAVGSPIVNGGSIAEKPSSPTDEVDSK